MEHTHGGHPIETSGAGHEFREANVKLIAFAAIGLAISVILSAFLVWGIFNYLKFETAAEEHELRLSPLAGPTAFPPEPRIEEHPWEQLPKLRQREEQLLNGYSWIDQKGGVVRIPIDRAMDLLLERGLPVKKETGQSQAVQHASKSNR
jgi:hypothetical protein